APSEVDCSAVVAHAMEDLKSAIDESGASIDVGPLPQIVAHEGRMLQLFMNLLLNAIRYHRPEVPPHIVIRAEQRQTEYIFSVADNGIGIDPAYHQQVFGVFKRLHSSEVSGTGIGLAICRRIVEQYGGSIWVESEGEGKGSTFLFTIPVRASGSSQ